MAEQYAREAHFCTRGTWVLLFLFFFTVFFALHGSRITPDGASPTRFFLLTGDEPHYLLVAHSLVFDGDIDLFNNLLQQDYRAFSDRPVSGYVKWKQWVLDRVGRRSILHGKPDSYWERRALPTQPIGTAALIAPVYRLGFAWGRRIRFTVTLFFHALLALLALVMIELCWRFTGKRLLSLLVAGASAFSAPLLFYSIPVFPDLPGALLIALSILLLFRMQQEGVHENPLRALALGACSASLPWVHLRFWPTALLIAVAAVWPLPGRRRHNAVFALPWTFSLIGLARYYWMLFGVPWPVSTAPPFSLGIGLGSGWPGLLLDRDHGLLAYTPLALFAVPGMIVLVGKAGRVGLVAVALFLGYVGLVGANAGWNGGLSPPLRYWVPVLPLVTLAVAAAVARTATRGAKTTALALGMVGPVIAVWGMIHPPWLYTYRHPLLAHGPWSTLWARLPVFFPEAGKWSLAAAVLAAVAIGLFTRWVLGPRRGPGRCGG